MNASVPMPFEEEWPVICVVLVLLRRGMVPNRALGDMTMNRRIIGAGVAVLLAGALLGWGTSTISHSARFGAANAVVDQPIANGEPKDQPSGDLTPRESYASPRETHRSAPPAKHRTVRRTPSGITVPAGTLLSIEVATDVSSKTSS